MVFIGKIFAQTEFLIQNPDRQDDRNAEYQAGVEGALRVYEVLLKTNSKDRQPYLDDLIQRRDAGTLEEFVKERSGRRLRQLTLARSRDAMRLRAIFDPRFEFRLEVYLDGRFAAETMLIFFSLLRRFFLDIDVA